MSLDAGTRLGPYTIVSLLGRGGMGEVYRARDERLGRDVAVKVLPADLNADPDRRSRLDREARAAAALNHPNIVAIHDVGCELLEGRTLRALLEEKRITPERVVDDARQIPRTRSPRSSGRAAWRRRHSCSRCSAGRTPVRDPARMMGFKP